MNHTMENSVTPRVEGFELLPRPYHKSVTMFRLGGGQGKGIMSIEKDDKEIKTGVNCKRDRLVPSSSTPLCGRSREWKKGMSDYLLTALKGC